MAGGLIPRDQTEQVADLYRKVRRLGAAGSSGGGGFDPNADPVVIGLSADGHGQTGAVAIGSYAQTLSGDCIAIGDSAYASGDSNIAIGVSADVRGDTNIGIGSGAHAGSSAISAAAIGNNAAVNHDSAVAIGHNAATTADHQIMLGTDLDFVEIPGRGFVETDTVTGTRYIIQITSGALVLNAAP